MPKLTYTDTEGAPSEHTVRDAPVTIGRSAECDVRISGDGVGRLHAVVEPSDGKLRVKDQGSRDGTWVGEEKVTDALLGDGDAFRVGGVTFTVALSGGSASSRRAGAEGEDGERKSSRRISQRPKREILGGIRLSKTQQIIIKIVCAVVILFCIAAIFGLIDKWRNPSVEYAPRVTYVNQEDEPRKLVADAVELARSARAAEQGGSVDVAFELITKAKKSAEEARDLITVLAEKHPGDTYWRLHELAAEINKQTATINSEAFRIEMQIQKAGGGE